MANMVKGRADYLALGDWNTVCYECGRKRKASTLKRHWQGYYVCPEHWEARHPQDFVRGVQDIVTPPWAQPMPADQFIGITYQGSVSEGVTLGFFCDTNVYPYGLVPTVTVSESLATRMVFAAGISEGVTTGTVMGINYVPTLAETVTTGESLSYTLSFGTGITETVTLTEVPVAVETLIVSLTESVLTGADLYSGDLPAVIVVTGDSLTTAVTWTSVDVESVVTGDSFDSAATLISAYTESGTATETLAAANLMGATFTESVTLTDSFVQGLVYASSISEGTTASESMLSGASTFAATISAEVAITVDVSDGSPSRVAESMTPTVDLVQFVAFRPSIAETVNTSTQWGSAWVALISAGELVTTTSGLTAVTTFNVSFTEAVTAIDILTVPGGSALNASAVNSTTVN